MSEYQFRITGKCDAMAALNYLYIYLTGKKHRTNSINIPPASQEEFDQYSPTHSYQNACILTLCMDMHGLMNGSYENYNFDNNVLDFAALILKGYIAFWDDSAESDFDRAVKSVILSTFVEYIVHMGKNGKQ